jgi:phosphoribosylanthranilate isomerase
VNLKLRVKICCIRNVAEAALAVRHGAVPLGLVSAMPSGPAKVWKGFTEPLL